jgi:hypothetical protein
MRAPISVLLPTFDAASWLPSSLSSLMEGLDAGLIRELIVVDGGSTDGTVAMAVAAGAEVVTGGNCEAVKAARGDWLLLLQPEVQLGQGWAQPVLTHIATRTKPACLRKAPKRGPLSWLTILRAAAPSYTALLVPAATYRALGADMQDKALYKALRSQMVPLDATVNPQSR